MATASQPRAGRFSNRHLPRLVILLGPYRNLSTLTAATLALHPECQVLNHGGERLLRHDRDFIANPSDEAYRAFMEAAWETSLGGGRGNAGGAIVHSHAFDEPAVRDRYAARFSGATEKPNARCLVWKESMRVQRRFQDDPRAFRKVCAAFPGIRFILPIRHPLDCAKSNLRSRHHKHLGIRPGPSLETVLQGVLGAIAWALAERDNRPRRIFAFDETEVSPALFGRLASFLGIANDARWLNDAVAVFRVRPRQRTSNEIAQYRTAANRELAVWPDLIGRLGA